MSVTNRVIRKFSLGQHSFKSVDFEDAITIENSLDDDEVVAKFKQSLDRIHRAWDQYRKFIEERDGIELPAY